MLNFEFNLPTRVIFGSGTHLQVGGLIKPYARKLLLHYGGGSIKQNGLYDAVTSSLNKADIEYVELGGVQPNPRVTLVREGIALCREKNVDFILAVGGGSVIDSAKAIAAGIFYPDDIWSLFDTSNSIERTIPIGTVLTIPAAGSESSADCVLSNDEVRQKLSYTHALLRPFFSIVNPELFATLPKNQIAYGVADIMSHVFERYFTNTLKTELTDRFCEATVKTVIKSAPLALANPENYDAMCQLGLSGTLAHNGLLGIGREEDWACHAMEHELSAQYDVAHGAGLAVLTPAWMRYVCRKNLGMFVQFAVKMMGVDGSYRESEDIASEGIDRLEQFYDTLGLPTRMGQLNINNADYADMAECIAGNNSSIGNLQKLFKGDIKKIFELAT